MFIFYFNELKVLKKNLPAQEKKVFSNLTQCFINYRKTRSHFRILYLSIWCIIKYIISDLNKTKYVWSCVMFPFSYYHATDKKFSFLSISSHILQGLSLICTIINRVNNNRFSAWLWKIAALQRMLKKYVIVSYWFKITKNKSKLS